LAPVLPHLAGEALQGPIGNGHPLAHRGAQVGDGQPIGGLLGRLQLLDGLLAKPGRLRVLRINGIVRCVHFDGAPARLREETVEQLQRAQQAPERLSVADLRPPVGETVTVTEGPLQGLTGEVQEHRGQMHILVRVTAIRQAMKVEVPADWVETAPAES
jgi:hypothetical protein